MPPDRHRGVRAVKIITPKVYHVGRNSGIMDVSVAQSNAERA